MLSTKLVTLTDGFFRLVDEQSYFTDFKVSKNDDELILEIPKAFDEYTTARHILAGYSQLTKAFGGKRISFMKEGVTCPVSTKDSPLGISVRYKFTAEVSASTPSS